MNTLCSSTVDCQLNSDTFRVHLAVVFSKVLFHRKKCIYIVSTAINQSGNRSKRRHPSRATHTTTLCQIMLPTSTLLRQMHALKSGIATFMDHCHCISLVKKISVASVTAAKGVWPTRWQCIARKNHCATCGTILCSVFKRISAAMPPMV